MTPDCIVNYYEDKIFDEGPKFLPSSLKSSQENYFNEDLNIPQSSQPYSEEILRLLQNKVTLANEDLQTKMNEENRRWILQVISKEVKTLEKKIKEEKNATYNELGHREYQERYQLLEKDSSWKNCSTLQTLRLKVGAQGITFLFLIDSTPNT